MTSVRVLHYRGAAFPPLVDFGTTGRRVLFSRRTPSRQALIGSLPPPTLYLFQNFSWTKKVYRMEIRTPKHLVRVEVGPPIKPSGSNASLSIFGHKNVFTEKVRRKFAMHRILYLVCVCSLLLFLSAASSRHGTGSDQRPRSGLPQGVCKDGPARLNPSFGAPRRLAEHCCLLFSTHE